MNKKLNSSKGFTLVEIMIVVVIIGLLAAMAIPAFQKVRVSSIEKTMVNDGRLLGAAVQQYCMEYGVTQSPAITYVPTSGELTGDANFIGYINSISKGYTETGWTINASATATAAFTLTKQPAFPGQSGVASFNGEGKLTPQ